MGFDPKQYLQEDADNFDPHAYAADHEAKAEPKTTAGMAALEHYGNAATLGYLPHIQSMVEQALPNPTGDVDEELRAKGIKIQQSEPNYIKSRDENIKRLELQSKEHPYASAAGTVGGVIGGGMITGAAGLGVKGATTGARVLSAGKTGAVLGAIQNPGDMEGELNPLQLDARGKNAATGAVVGGVVQGAVDAVPTASNKVAQYLKDKAEKRAFKALGPSLRDVRKNYPKESINDIGRTLLDEGVVGKPTSYQGIADRVDKVKGAKGKDLEKILGDLDSEVAGLTNGPDGLVPAGVKVPNARAGIDRKAIAQSMRDDLITGAKNTDIPTTAAKNAKVSALIDEFENGGDDLLGLLETEMKKRAVGKEINWDRLYGADIPVEEQVLRSLYTKLKTGVEDGAQAVEGSTGRTAFRDAKRTYGNLDEASKISSGKEQREFANRFLSPSDYGVGLAGAAIGGTRGDTVEDRVKNIALGASLGLGNKFLRTQGNQILAKGLDQAGSAAQLPSKLAEMIKNNPVAAHILSKTSPSLANSAKGGGKFLSEAESPILQNQKLMEQFQKDPSLIDSVQDPRLKAQIKRRLAQTNGTRSPGNK